MGRPLRVDGSGHTFDFTHLSDTVRGLLLLIENLRSGQDNTVLHFLTGLPTTLGELAELVVELAGSSSPIHEAAPRSFDVGRFYGDPGKAARILGWHPQVPLREGLLGLIADLRADLEPVPA
jgi:nucleoside-diphosphate-sugar epimerase